MNDKNLSPHQKELLQEMKDCEIKCLELYISGEDKGRWEFDVFHGGGGILRSTGNILLEGGHLEQIHPQSSQAHHKEFYRPKGFPPNDTCTSVNTCGFLSCPYVSNGRD